MENKTTRTKNKWTTLDEHMKAVAAGLSMTSKDLHLRSTSTKPLTAIAACTQRTGCLGQPMMPTVTNGKDHLKLTQNMKQKTWKRR